MTKSLRLKCLIWLETFQITIQTLCACVSICVWSLKTCVASRQESLRTMTECQCDVRTADLIFHPSTAGRRWRDRKQMDSTQDSDLKTNPFVSCIKQPCLFVMKNWNVIFSVDDSAPRVNTRWLCPSAFRVPKPHLSGGWCSVVSMWTSHTLRSLQLSLRDRPGAKHLLMGKSKNHSWRWSRGDATFHWKSLLEWWRKNRNSPVCWCLWAKGPRRNEPPLGRISTDLLWK